MSDIDFAHTAEAERRREAKAKTVARHLYDNLISAAEAAAYTDGDRRRVEKAAGVRRCGPETWDLIVDLLTRKARYIAEHAPTVDDDEPDDTDTPAAAATQPVTPDETPHHPCSHFAADDGYCAATPTRRYLPGFRCDAHTPAALAGRVEVTPDPTRTLTALREAAGIPVAPIPPQSQSTLIDLNAVASGKRRSSSNTYRSARAERGRRRAG